MQTENLWLIHENALDSVKVLCADPKAILTRPGRKADGAQKTVMRGSVAVIPINGLIMPQSNGLTEFFDEIVGVTTLDKFAQDFQQALDNPNVSAIILNVNSPGGLTTSVKQAADLVYSARAQKPVAAFVQGLGASAAYFIASSASRMTLDPMALVGSIGTVFEFQMAGEAVQKYVRTVEIVSEQSPMKRADPTTEAGKAEWQRIANEMTDVFIQTVARNRGVSQDAVLSDFGRGSMRVGADAVKNNMADAVGSLEELIFNMQNKLKSPMTSARAEEETQMTILEKIKALVNGEPAEQKPALEPNADAQALAAENTQLKERIAEMDATAAAAKAAADAKIAEADKVRVEAAVKSFMAEHRDRMGKALYGVVEPAYKKAQETKDQTRIDEITAMVKALPLVGQAERVKAGGPEVEEKAKIAGGDKPLDPTAAHFETLARLEKAGIKQGTAEFAPKYRETLVAVEKEMGVTHAA